jgi:spore maturation protein CgeB
MVTVSVSSVILRSTSLSSWFSDDVFRFAGFSSAFARSFDWIITADPPVVPKYKALGAKNVVYERWACNPFLYHTSPELQYDVTFVGQPHSHRKEAVQALRDAGINVQTWGRGWENGRASQEDMIKIFGQSRINLNFSDASKRPGLGGKLGLKLPKQVKARLLEVPACGGFLLTGDAPLLKDYYDEGKDVAVFRSTAELVEKVKYYLSHEAERAAIAKSGYERTMREHTYVHRISGIFQRMGFETAAPADVLAGKVHAGTSRDITTEVKHPLVSVVTSVYNGARYLRPTIESILAQQFRDWEFIIIDDGSTDETPQIIAEYAAKDPRIRTKLLGHAGKVTGFNTGFALARGEFIAVTGADDISLPNRLTTQVNEMQAHPEIGAMGSWVDLIDADGKVFGMLKHPASSAFLKWSLLLRNPMAACATMVRKTAGDALGWYRETASEDHEFLSRVSQKYALSNWQAVLAQYRVWQGNFTSLHGAEEEGTITTGLQERGSTMLGETLSEDDAKALRQPLAGGAMTLPQIRRAAGLYRRLHAAYASSQTLSFADAQLIRDDVTEYYFLLAKKAEAHSAILPWLLRARALLRNPLFLLQSLRRKLSL